MVIKSDKDIYFIHQFDEQYKIAFEKLKSGIKIADYLIGAIVILSGSGIMAWFQRRWFGPYSNLVILVDVLLILLAIVLLALVRSRNNLLDMIIDMVDIDETTIITQKDRELSIFHCDNDDCIGCEGDCEGCKSNPDSEPND
ncbi:MAG: hypothetical protein WCQ49_00490 [Candidatus Saccharibacteria bacterium]